MLVGRIEAADDDIRHGSDLRESAVDEQLDAGDVAAVLRGEERHGAGDVIGPTEAAERDPVAKRSFRPSLSVWRRPRSPSVSIAPGLTTLTRILRSLRSVVRVRANDRSAALVALYTLTAGFPFDPTMDEVKMIEAPSRRSGSAFCTVKSAPLTLAPNVRSKSSSVMSPSGAASAMPAFAKRMSMRPLLSF